MSLWEDGSVTTLARRSARGALGALIGVSVAGTVDVAEFLATRSAMFTDAPGRAAGSVVGLIAWAALFALATMRYARSSDAEFGQPRSGSLDSWPPGISV